MYVSDTSVIVTHKNYILVGADSSETIVNPIALRTAKTP